MAKIFMATRDDVTSLGGNIAPIVDNEMEKVWEALAAKGVQLPEDRSLASLAGAIAQLDDSGFGKLVARETAGNVALPETITNIGSHAFDGCEGITSVSAKECADVGEGAFRGCASLSSVYLPKLTRAGEEAFSSTAIRNTDGLRNLVTAASNCFGGCTSLVSAVLDRLSDESETPWGLFSNCSNLEYVSLGSFAFPDTSLFYDCPKLARIVTLNIDDTAYISDPSYDRVSVDVPDGMAVWDVRKTHSSVAMTIFAEALTGSRFQKKFHIWCKDGWLGYSDGSWSVNAYPDEAHEDSPLPILPVETDYGFYKVVPTDVGSDTVHVFTNTDPNGFSIELPEGVNEVRYLIVGGGGGGGSSTTNWGGNGGGAGGFKTGTVYPSGRTVTASVGQGGAGGRSSSASAGTDGSPSTLRIGTTFSFTMPGGGGGGKGSAGSVAGSGASCGGYGHGSTASGELVPASDGAYYGNLGGLGTNGVTTTTQRFGGGGGGIISAGLSPVRSTKSAGAGGDGTTDDITDVMVGYAGGGGGGSGAVSDTACSGGAANYGGGKGGDYATNGRGENGLDGTGGGGGGSAGSGVSGGNGGSGVIVIRYKNREVA